MSALSILIQQAEQLTSDHLEKFNLEEGFSYDPEKNQLPQPRTAQVKQRHQIHRRPWFMNVDLARRTLEESIDEISRRLYKHYQGNLGTDFIIPKRLAKKPKDAAQAKTAAFKKKRKISIEGS